MNKIKRNTWVNRICELLRNYIGIISCLFIFLIGVIFITLVLLMKIDIIFIDSIDDTLWGYYGEFIGGLLGTIVSIFNVYYLIRTLREQQSANEKVSKSNKDIAEVYLVQQFENNYQHLISLYKDAISGYKDDNLIGRGALKKKIDKMYNLYDDYERNYNTRMMNAISLFEENFYIPNRVAAAVHFRVLYHIFFLIDSSELDSKKIKTKYAKLVRSQIDEDELVLLRYNCWCKCGEKMCQLVNHYNLLKHLPLLSLLEFKYWRNYVITDVKCQNAMDTELIAQRKWIRDNFNTQESSRECKLRITDRYEVEINIFNNKQNFSYTLIRHDNVISTYSVDNAYDLLSDVHPINFIKDFLHEVFEYSNFSIYNKEADIMYTDEGIMKDCDRMTTYFKVNLKSKLPMNLRYEDYIKGSSEESPTRIKKKNTFFIKIV